jgi:hypothetical protein
VVPAHVPIPMTPTRTGFMALGSGLRITAAGGTTGALP